MRPKVRRDSNGRFIAPPRPAGYRGYPCVSIGLPVYNGERFLAQAIESVLSQTYQHFELIICDNASTDRTRQIAEKYVARDMRVRYHRNVSNLGAAANFNKAYLLGRGLYFKWLAADDVMAPRFLEQCVKALDENHGAAVAFTKTQGIDANGDILPGYANQPDMHFRRSDVVGRYRTLMDEMTFGRTVRAWPMVYIFGLMRNSALRRTRLMQRHIDSDSNLIAELLLQGEFVEVPEYLSFIRGHEESYSWSARSADERQAFFDPKALGAKGFKRMLSRRWRFVEFFLAIARADIHLTQKASLFAYQLTRLLRRRLQVGIPRPDVATGQAVSTEQVSATG